MPRTLITDSGNKNLTYNPNRKIHFNLLTEDNPNNKNSRASQESTRCGQQGHQTHNTGPIRKTNQQTELIEGQGQANPNPKIPVTPRF